MGKWVLYTQSNYAHPKPTHLTIPITAQLVCVNIDSIPNIVKDIDAVLNLLENPI